MKTDEPKRDENTFCRGQRMIFHGTLSYFDHYQASIGIVLGLHRSRSLVRLNAQNHEYLIACGMRCPKICKPGCIMYMYTYNTYIYIRTSILFFRKRGKKNRCKDLPPGSVILARNKVL